MSVSVIVVNWNGLRWLDGCLDALRRQHVPECELVVVDNASSDGSADHVRSSHPDVRLIALDRNRGFAGGNNAGAASARADYLVFLNNDTRVRPGWLQALVDVADRDPSVGLVTSQIVYMDEPDVVDSAGDGYLRAGGGFKHFHGLPAASASSSREVFGACGGAFLIRRSLFEALNGFDEDFFMVYEDVDLSYRARLLGARVIYAHDAVVEHAGSGSLGRVSDRAVFFGQRNLEWTWLKNSPRRLLWRSALPHLLYDIAGGVAYARRGQLRPWMKGKWAAFTGIRSVMTKRATTQRLAVADRESLWAMMDANWIAVKREEKRFDFQYDSRA
jgi:GT2 family glycosyltransferase